MFMPSIWFLLPASVSGVYRGTISSPSSASTPPSSRSITNTPTRTIPRSDTVGSGVGHTSTPHSTVGVEATSTSKSEKGSASGSRDASTWPHSGAYYMKESCV